MWWARQPSGSPEVWHTERNLYVLKGLNPVDCFGKKHRKDYQIIMKQVIFVMPAACRKVILENIEESE